MRVARFREARRTSIEELARETGIEASVLKRLVRKLSILERRAALELEARGLRAREARPASIRGSRVYTGDWIGVVSLEAMGEAYTIVVEPKTTLIAERLCEAERVLLLAGAGPILADLEAALAAGGAIRHPGAGLAAALIEEYARSHPPTPHTAATIQYMVYAALANTVKPLLEAGAPRPLAERVAAPLEAIIASPHVMRALQRHTALDPEEDRVVEVALLARASLLHTRGEGSPRAALLYPTPKLYELIILAHILKALVERGCRAREATARLVRLSCPWGEARLYYNTAPRSRLVERLTGSRLHPDIVVEVSGRLAVIEAKYRRCGRLTRADAARIAAYHHDISPDILVIAHPDCERVTRVDGKTLIAPHDHIPELLEHLVTRGAQEQPC